MKTVDESRIDAMVACALVKKLGQLQSKVVLERAVERELVAGTKAGQVMPADYWLPRHRAEVRLRHCASLLEAFL